MDNGTTTLTKARRIASVAVMRLGSYDPTNQADVFRLDAAIKAAGDQFSFKLFPDRRAWSFNYPAESKFGSFKDPTDAVAFVIDTVYDVGDIVIDPIDSKPYQAIFTKLMDINPSQDKLKWAPVIQNVPIEFSPRRVRGAQIIDNTNGRRMRQNLVDVQSIKDYMWKSYGFVYSPNLVLPSAVGSAFFTEGLMGFDVQNEQLWSYPQYSNDVTINLHYWVPFVDWELGGEDVDADEVILNIPDSMINGILYFLVPQYYDMSQASNDYIKTCKANMKQHYLGCTRALKGSSTQMSSPMLYGDLSGGGMF